MQPSGQNIQQTAHLMHSFLFTIGRDERHDPVLYALALPFSMTIAPSTSSVHLI